MNLAATSGAKNVFVPILVVLLLAALGWGFVVLRRRWRRLTRSGAPVRRGGPALPDEAAAPDDADPASG